MQKIWLISDPHGRHGFLDIPEDLDMIICAGDIATTKEPYINNNEVLDFLEWFTCMPAKYKIFIPGNHDTSIEKGYLKGNIPDNLIMLNHNMKTIGGLRIFGSPLTPTFGTGWAYNVKREKLHTRWAEIPPNIDILITHGPPKGVLDLSKENVSTGDLSLWKKVKELKPKIHVFGHIHEEGGRLLKDLTIPETTFYNACVMNLEGQMINNGFIVEL